MTYRGDLDEKELDRRKAAINAAITAGYKHKADITRTAARALGITYVALESFLRKYPEKLQIQWPKDFRTVEAIAEAPPPSAREVHDLAYWKQLARTQAQEIGSLETALGELTGLMGRPVEPAKWLMPKATRSGRAVGLLQISDVHAGEVIAADATRNLNAYDLEICRKRLRQLFLAACRMPLRWASDCKLEGFVLALNGDLISGAIHEELIATNALTSSGQTWFVTDELASGIEKLADTYGNVFVASTPGNHGRSNYGKPWMKRYSQLSYDTMAAEALARHFKNDPRVRIAISPSRDIVYPIFGWTVFQTHGDALGTGGGKGFIGPLAPIVRGTKQVELQGYDVLERYKLILTGHFHTSANPGRGKLANGSIPGYNEYGQGLRASIEVPQQWLALVHDKWGLRERCEIQLEEPQVPSSTKSGFGL